MWRCAVVTILLSGACSAEGGSDSSDVSAPPSADTGATPDTGQPVARAARYPSNTLRSPLTRTVADRLAEIHGASTAPADQVFMSVGSCNYNNRGLIYEAELNVSVLDRDWVSAERHAILAHFLGEAGKPAATVDGWFSQLAKAAEVNDAVAQAWEDEGGDIDLDGDPLPSKYKPRGFLFGNGFGTVSDCLFESIGPDTTYAPVPGTAGP